jgi:hypothetical protein
MGCYNTLWAMRARLENQKAEELDDLDQRTQALVKRWMGFDAWPATPEALAAQQKAWKCQRTECSYHAQHCLHGLRKRT